MTSSVVQVDQFYKWRQDENTRMIILCSRSYEIQQASAYEKEMISCSPEDRLKPAHTEKLCTRHKAWDGN